MIHRTIISYKAPGKPKFVRFSAWIGDDEATKAAAVIRAKTLVRVYGGKARVVCCGLWFWGEPYPGMLKGTQ